MPTQNQIVQQMIQGLSVTLPTLDTTIGSPVRQILDVAAEQLSELTADQYLLSYQYDINNMSGANLDAFCGLFGITRFPAKRAVGYVTLSRQTPATSDITFGAGSQVATVGSPPQVFTFIYPVSLVASSTSVTVAVQAAVAGSAGNVSADTITQAVLSGAFSSISSVTNVDATSGGTDPESDDQLIARFKATVFRQLTGTAPMFLATALNDPNVTLGNVLGATEVFNEQIALSGGVGVSSVTDLAYFYPGTAYFGVDLSLGDIFSPGVQYSIESNFVARPDAPIGLVTTGGSGTKTAGTYLYGLTFTNAVGQTVLGDILSVTISGGTTNNVVLNWTIPAGLGIVSTQVFEYHSGSFQELATVAAPTATYTDTGLVSPSGAPPETNTTGAPVVTSLDSINVPDGIYQLQYNYLSSASRNDPPNGITNRIDVYANGTRPVEALQNITYNAALVFNVTDDTSLESPFSMNVELFERLDGTHPEPGNIFTPVAFSPIIDMASGLSTFGLPISPMPIQGETWVENSNYWIVKDVSPYGLGPNSRCGIEWGTIGSFPGPGPNWKTDTLTLTGLTSEPLTVPDVNTASIIVTNLLGSVTYTLGTDYAESTVSGITSIARLGGGAITSGQQVLVTYNYNNLSLQLDYLYNQIPKSVQDNIQTWRLVTTDVMVHQAKELLLDMFFSYIGTVPPATLLPSVYAAISNYVSNTSFNGILQVSDIISLVQQTPGVTACRFINSGDTSLILFGTGPRNGQAVSAGPYFAIQSVNPVGGGVVHTYATTTGTPHRALDVYLTDDTLATLNNVYLVQQGQNTFGAV